MKSKFRSHVKKLWFLPIIALALAAFVYYWSQKSVPQPVTILSSDTSLVSHLALSPDGAQLAEVVKAQRDPVIRFFSTYTDKMHNVSSTAQDLPLTMGDTNQVSIAAQENPLIWISYTTDGKTLNSVDSAGAMLQWDAKTGMLRTSNRTYGLDFEVCQSP